MTYRYTNSQGRSYVLHAKRSTLRDGSQRTLYYFAKEPKDGALDDLPRGYQVRETRTGLPVLKQVSAISVG